MSAADGDRAPKSQSARTTDWWSLRKTRHLDPSGAVIAHAAHSPYADLRKAAGLVDGAGATIAATDVPTTAAGGTAAWGPKIPVLGIERLTLYAEIPAGSRGGLTDLQVIAQVAFVDNPSDSQWYDVHTDQATPGTLVSKAWSKASLSGAALIVWAFQMPSLGVYMRFKVFGTAAGGGSRVTLRATRVQDSI